LFLPLHEAARFFNRALLLPAFGFWLRRFAAQSGLELRVLPRNSLMQAGSFNLFLSDIDIAILLRHEPGPGVLAPLLAAYSHAERIIPFLGELEIYTDAEWQKRSQILKRHQKWIDLIWNLRKWIHQFNQYSHAPTQYHRYKALISIQKIKRKLGVPDLQVLNPKEISLSKILEPYLDPALFQGPAVNGRSEYLLWDFERIPLGFLAILPDSEFSISEHRDRLLELRKQPEIGAIAVAVATWERLLCVSRGRLFQTKYDEPWQAHLSKIEEFFPG
jgi:hypothetical protein